MDPPDPRGVPPHGQGGTPPMTRGTPPTQGGTPESRFGTPKLLGQGKIWPYSLRPRPFLDIRGPFFEKSTPFLEKSTVFCLWRPNLILGFSSEAPFGRFRHFSGHFRQKYAHIRPPFSGIFRFWPLFALDFDTFFTVFRVFSTFFRVFFSFLAIMSASRAPLFREKAEFECNFDHFFGPFFEFGGGSTPPFLAKIGKFQKKTCFCERTQNHFSTHFLLNFTKKGPWPKAIGLGRDLFSSFFMKKRPP
jgi:hypothetical protein